MQLNPARGRKLCPRRGAHDTKVLLLVYAAQPREGTETRRVIDEVTLHVTEGGLCSSTPRGDGNTNQLARDNNRNILGLCSSTPRGDGNLTFIPTLSPLSGVGFMQLNPARGRKLGCYLNLVVLWHCLRFMQLNPARGRKQNLR